ncbi:MAG: hypothetical protein ACRDGP_09960 [Actinomycetota bacterium]
MRRVLAATILAVLTMTLAISPASAGERQRSQFFYTNWKSHHRVDANTEDVEYWYLSAYRYGDRSGASIYHSIYRCRKTDGHRRCHRRTSEYGRTRNLAEYEFIIDRKLSGAHLATSMRLRSGREVVGIADVVADLTGRGQVTRTKEAYSYQEGCELYKYNGHSQYRRAEGRPSVIVGGEARDIDGAPHGRIGVGGSVSIEKEC